MAQGLKVTVLGQLLTDTSDLATQFGKMLSELNITFTEFVHNKILIGASQTDVALDFGGVANARAVLLLTDAACTAKVTGSATPNDIPIESALLLTAPATGSTITALSISTGATPVGGTNVEYIIVS